MAQVRRLQGQPAPVDGSLGTGNLTSIDDGRTLAPGFLDENADVCLGVGGAIDQSCMAAIQEYGVTGAGIGGACFTPESTGSLERGMTAGPR